MAAKPYLMISGVVFALVAGQRFASCRSGVSGHETVAPRCE